jgi:Bacterial PH domain
VSNPSGEIERRLFVGHPSMFRNYPLHFIFASILFPAGIGAFFLLRWWLKSIGTTLTVTSVRTTERNGLIARNVNEILNANVRNVQVRQTALQRIFGVGTIGVSTSGQSGVEIEVEGILDPMRVKRLIDSPKNASPLGPAPLDFAGLLVFLVCAGTTSALFASVVFASKAANDSAVPAAAVQRPNVVNVDIRPPAKIQANQADREPNQNAEAATDPITPAETDENREKRIARETKLRDDQAEMEKQRQTEARNSAALKKLELAKGIQNKNQSSAVKRLNELIEAYGDTPAADEARQLLDKLK